MDLKFVYADGGEIIEHDIDLKIEVLLHVIAGISADFHRYFRQKEIDMEKDDSNPLVMMHWDVVMMRRAFYKMEMTMEQVMKAQHKILYIRDFLKRLT